MLLDSRAYLPTTAERAARYNYEYQGNNTCNLFILFQPTIG
jgi:hypothetical protein